MIQKGDFKPWTMSQQPTADSVILSSYGKKEMLLPIPPGFVVTQISTKNDVDQVSIYFDRVNGVWLAAFDRDPEKIKVGVRPATQGELGSFPTLEFVDGQGQVLSKDAVKALLKKEFPAVVVDILEEAKNLPEADRREIIDQILKSFYYSTNLYLNSATYKQATP